MTSITLYAYPTMPGFFNGSPFCGKADILLKEAGLDFTTVMPENPKGFSKGKLPVLKDGDEIIEDSEFIRLHLIEKYGATLDRGLSVEAKAVGHAVCRMLDERTVYGLAWSRWVEDEGWVQAKEIFLGGDADGIGEPMRREIREGYTFAGFGRHSAEEQRQFIQSDIDCVATLLGAQEWFLANQPTYLDASVFSYVANFYASPIKTWLIPMAAKHDNLVAYFERGMERWYPEGLEMLKRQAAE